ncbi:hypothetical protein CAPTEDRAFT_190663 [Capitella teleta]|uniref:G-protein coupled receptors family 1 profile domain-containing protein n=1 Tax=Capitella teleta TaxID=283909 RepID=R7TCQ0_CAPTE|nr:hypothetical protein CAPTEDRAFT_190663 [Capitella teleta]|eukprot:ELT88851.1 hypothetical protein CAPTEDRAFT_190663 [Capitella teleta]
MAMEIWDHEYNMIRPTGGPDFYNESDDVVGDHNTEDSYFYEWHETAELLATRNIVLYISPVCLFFGTFGNFISMIAMSKLCVEAFSTCAYLAILGLADWFLLYTRCGNEWLLELTGKDISQTLMLYSQSICKVYPFVFNFILHLSKWLLVAVSIEGLIAMKYPQKALTMCTLSKAKAVIILLTVLLVCVNVHYFWTFELLNENGMLMCTFSKYDGQLSEEFVTDVWPVTEFLVAEALPIIVIAISAFLMIILTARGLHRGSAAHQVWRSRYTIDPPTENHLKRTYLIVSVSYVVFCLPSAVFAMVSPYYNSYETHDKILLAKTLCEMLHYCLMSSKFFIYLVSCPRFRTVVVGLLRCGCCHDDAKDRARKQREHSKSSLIDHQGYPRMEQSNM